LEPVTHFLTGASLGRAFFNRKSALATLTATLAAEAPDIDVLAYFGGSITGFAHHRGITHTFLGAPFMAALVVLLVWIMERLWLASRREKRRARRGKWVPPPPNWKYLYVVALVAGLSHILLDFTNGYGVRPLSPFLHRWYSWDIVFIVDPLILAALFLGLIMPAIFALVSEDIGARQKTSRGRGGAMLALGLIVCVWGFRDFQHRRAVAALQAVTYEGQEAIRARAYPYALSPFQWYGIVETQDAFHSMLVNSHTPEVDADDRAEVRRKPPETEVTLAAKRSRLGQVYLDWAAFPWLETEKLDTPEQRGYIVRFRDVRFMYPETRSRNTLGAYVVLDPNLNVVQQSFSSRRQAGQRFGVDDGNGSDGR
jgi:inner membrane protein